MSHTPTPWKTVSTVNFDNGLTYVSVQPVEPDPDTMGPLRMMSGEYHVCRMSHTAARHRIDMYLANADFIVNACNAHDDLVSIVKRWLALDAGAWHVERHASEKKELLSDTRSALAKAEVQS